jgi:hypothetical protein
LLNEFRAVSILSFLHLAILYDSPAIVDLKATASSPEMRLKKMAERVGMKPNPKTKPFLDLSSPFSVLMQSIETGAFNDAAGAQTLFLPVSDISRNAEVVIDQYTLATGRDLKSQAVSVVPRSTSSAVPASRRQAPPPQLAAPRLDGRTTPRQ